jgi:hypothetical protein
MSKPQGLERPEGLGELKNSPYRVSSLRPSGLQHSALITTLPLASVVLCGCETWSLDIDRGCLEQGTEVNIWTEDGWSDGRVAKTA